MAQTNQLPLVETPSEIITLMKSLESDRHIPISERTIKSTRETFSAPADANMVATTGSDGQRDRRLKKKETRQVKKQWGGRQHLS